MRSVKSVMHVMSYRFKFIIFQIDDWISSVYFFKILIAGLVLVEVNSSQTMKYWLK